ncbi:DUF6770 family protein [Carboxylicivirga linearis]|uniref:Uncharacterized protein n=1 Tax=Carboxylicivirga linearis TaxID=1628157 RepID=A0ABS5JT94_9BACT|nr:DUF6770 family protein [Carboxylicivirga linearis]MBS2098100.1 hypothetical protein [Carboxylicivirga linearis]
MKKIVLAISLLLCYHCVYSQTIEINDIVTSRFTDINPILSGIDGEVEGYCAFYMLEKESKGNRLFEFNIISKDLSSSNQTSISIHKNAEVNNVIFNGQYSLVSVDDRKNKQIKLYILDKAGKIVTEKTIETDKKRLAASTVFADRTGEGFYVVSPIDEKKKNGYTLSKVDNKLENIWRIEQTVPKGLKTVSDIISTKNQLVVWENFENGNKVKPTIISFDPSNGDKRFEYECYDGTNTLLYNNIRLDEEGNVFAGGAYVKGEKINGVNNEGVYLLKLTNTGKEGLYTKVNNKENIQEVLKKTNTSFSLGSKDKVLVEDLILKDDKIIVVSEMFRKNTNITPAAVQATRDLITGKYVGYAGGGSQPSEKGKVVMDIRDYIFFVFNKEGELEEIQPGLKEDNNKITCWYPYVNLPGMVLAKQLHSAGWFDYAFNTLDDNGEVILICKDNSSGDKPVVYSFNLTQNYLKNTIDLKHQSKLNLEKGKVSYFDVMKNDQGKMVNVYYQRKLNKITLTLESI